MGKLQKPRKNWDIIVLQTGTIGILIPENCEIEINKAISQIKFLAHQSKPDCKFILFDTWPSKSDYPKQYCRSSYTLDPQSKNGDNCSPIMSNLEEEIQFINKAYALIAKKNNILKSDNRDKFYNVLTTHPEINLYEDDSHPNKYGAFLNACVFYRMLTGKNPSDLKYTGNIESATANILKKISE